MLSVEDWKISQREDRGNVSGFRKCFEGGWGDRWYQRQDKGRVVRISAGILPQSEAVRRSSILFYDGRFSESGVGKK